MAALNSTGRQLKFVHKGSVAALEVTYVLLLLTA